MALPDAGESDLTPEQPQDPPTLRTVKPAEAERALRSPERPPHNLPSELSSFVGRKYELPEVRRLLENNRLLTLTGPGGCGKSRLALAAASELVEKFDDGVWMVELASLAEPTLVPQAVAFTLGVRERPGSLLAEALSDYLRTRNRGDVAQYVAIDHPAAVRSLILVVSACRLSEEGRETCERWLTLAHEGSWQELRADMASVNVTSEANKRLARAFMKVFGGLVFRVPSDPSDFLTTLEADLAHDTAGRLGEISAPALIIGGTEDPFFSEGLLRETGEKIPDATLRLYEGVGHGVPKERKRRYEEDTLAFLGTLREESSGKRDETIPSRTKETR